MQIDSIWQALDTTTVEHQRFTIRPDGSKHANGHIIGVIEDIPFRIVYEVRIDAHWCVREVMISDLMLGTTLVDLHADGAGGWSDPNGMPMSQFDGCIDIDFTATPLTNILPIRRLEWQVGMTHAIDVVYIVHPQFEVFPAKQSYTCLSTGATGARYHFKMGEFERDITVDADGFVIDYPGLFQRMWAKNNL